MKRMALLIPLLVILMTGAKAIEIPEVCANKVTFELRVSNVVDRCSKEEFSLGVGPIPYSLTAPKGLNKTLELRFKAAQVAAKKDGVLLEITSGYRSYDRQVYLFNRAIKKYGSYREAAKWVAPPEISHHPRGLAIDVNYPNEPASAKWLEINGYKFGLCRIFKNEWWHFEGNIAPGWKCPKMYKNALALLDS